MVTTVASSSQHRSHSIAVTTSQSQHRSHSIAISGHCKDNVAPVQLPPAPERQLTVRVMARVKVTATVTATVTAPHLSFVDLRFPRRGLRLGHAVTRASSSCLNIVAGSQPRSYSLRLRTVVPSQCHALQHLVAAARSLAVHDIRQRRRLRLQSPHRLSSETGT